MSVVSKEYFMIFSFLFFFFCGTHGWLIGRSSEPLHERITKEEFVIKEYSCFPWVFNPGCPLNKWVNWDTVCRTNTLGWEQCDVLELIQENKDNTKAIQIQVQYVSDDHQVQENEGQHESLLGSIKTVIDHQMAQFVEEIALNDNVSDPSQYINQESNENETIMEESPSVIVIDVSSNNESQDSPSVDLMENQEEEEMMEESPSVIVIDVSSNSESQDSPSVDLMENQEEEEMMEEIPSPIDIDDSSSEESQDLMDNEEEEEIISENNETNPLDGDVGQNEDIEPIESELIKSEEYTDDESVFNANEEEQDQKVDEESSLNQEENNGFEFLEEDNEQNN